MRTAISIISLLFIVCSCLPATAVVLMSDDFSGAGVDTLLWVVHGDQATSEGDSLEIAGLAGWTQGLSSVAVFERPPADSMVVVSGVTMVPETNWDCSASVRLQADWGGDATDCYGLDFDLDQIYRSGDRLLFEARSTGNTTARSTVGLFPSGEWFAWEIRVFDEGCEVYSWDGYEFGWRHTCTIPGDFAFRVMMTVSGVSGVAGVARFDDITVSREARTTEPHFVAWPRAGFPGLEVGFENQTSEPITSWDWDFGDGSAHSTDRDPTHTYTAVGDYTVTLTASGPLGTGEMVRESVVSIFDVFADDFSGPEVDRNKWELLGERVSCEGGSLEVISRYWWEQGVKSEAYCERPGPGEIIVVEGSFWFTERSAPSTAVVHLRRTDGNGEDDYALSFGHSGSPGVSDGVSFGGTADSTALPSCSVGEFETGEHVGWRMHVLPVGCDVFIDVGSGWEWQHGVSEGEHAFQLIIEGRDGWNSPTGIAYWDDISISREPQSVAAYFSASERAGPVPLTVEFADHSRGDIDTWVWDFGDSTDVSYEQHPVHTYADGGSYTVTLDVSGPAGQDIEVRESFVIASELADFTASPDVGPAPLTVQFTDASSAGVTSWDWDFGDGSPHSSDMNPEHTYTMPGEYAVTLSVEGASGSGSTTRPHCVVARTIWTAHSEEPLGDTGPSRNMSWVDYDRDGDDDIYIANNGDANRLLRNDGDGQFVDVTTGPLAGSDASPCAAWGDYDGDRDLDLFLVGYGAPGMLIRNDGGGVFSDVTAAPLDNDGPNLWAGWADYDVDGDLDLFIASYGEANVLLRNDSGVFVDVTPAVLEMYGTKNYASWVDYDLDGDPDLYVPARYQPNRLFRNDAGVFVDVTPPALEAIGVCYSASWADYDNDGDLDVYVGKYGANQMFKNDGGEFVDATTWPLPLSYSSLGTAWGDIDNDMDLDLYVANSGMYNAMLRNDGAGVFNNIVVPPIDDIHYTRGVGWSDYDGDGVIDLYICDGELSDRANKLFDNDTPWDGHWLKVDLAGTESNTFGVGATVRVVTGGTSQIRQIGCDTGYGSQSSFTTHFGLGECTVVDTLEIRWPLGAVTRYYDVECDQRLLVWEDAEAPPGAPRWVEAVVGEEPGSALVSWIPNLEIDLDHYVVERDTTDAFGSGTVSTIVWDAAHADAGLDPWSECWYRVTAVDEDGHASVPSDAVSVTPLPTGVAPEEPGSVQFSGPNPFSQSTAIAFSVPSAGTPVSIRVYDVAGRHVATLAEGEYATGRHALEWTGRDGSGHRVAAGVYFCRTIIGSRESVRKLVVIR